MSQKSTFCTRSFRIAKVVSLADEFDNLQLRNTTEKNVVLAIPVCKSRVFFFNLVPNRYCVSENLCVNRYAENVVMFVRFELPMFMFVRCELNCIFFFTRTILDKIPYFININVQRKIYLRLNQYYTVVYNKSVNNLSFFTNHRS